MTDPSYTYDALDALDALLDEREPPAEPSIMRQEEPDLVRRHYAPDYPVLEFDGDYEHWRDAG